MCKFVCISRRLLLYEMYERFISVMSEGERLNVVVVYM